MPKKGVLRRVFTKEDRQMHVRERAMDTLDTLLQDVYSKDINEASLKFYSLVHQFFGEYCNIRYKFTYTELIRYLKRIKPFDPFTRKKTEEFMQHLQDKEFSGTMLTKEELINLLNQLKLIIKSAGSSEKPSLPKISTSWQRLSLGIRSYLGVLHKKFAKDELAHIEFLVGYANTSLSENHLERAKKIYSEIDRLYSKLSFEEQKVVFADIKKLFERIEEFFGDDILNQIETLQDSIYKNLESGSVTLAKRSYDQMQELYDELPEKNKKRVYPAVHEVFKRLEQEIFRAKLTDINRLLSACVQSNSLNPSLAREQYSKANLLYEDLPASLKKKIYPELMKAYSHIS